MGDIEDTTEARGPLMPNLRPKPSLHPKLMLKLHHGVDTTVDTDTDTPVPTDMDTTATDTARGPLILNLRLKLHHGADTIVDTVDTTVDTVDTDMVVDTVTGLKLKLLVKMLKKTLKLPSGSSHSNSFNLATIPSIF